MTYKKDNVVLTEGLIDSLAFLLTGGYKAQFKRTVRAATDDLYKEFYVYIRPYIEMKNNKINPELKRPLTKQDYLTPIYRNFPSRIQESLNEDRHSLSKLIFKTAKGSIYFFHKDGTTTRDKAPRAEHPGDSGYQERSEKTIFLEDKIVFGLNPHGLNEKFAIIDNGDKTVSLTVFNTNAKKWGIFPNSKNLPYQTEPKIGLVPVELWLKGKIYGKDSYFKIHIGNKIIDIGLTLADLNKSSASSTTPGKRLDPDKIPGVRLFLKKKGFAEEALDDADRKHSKTTNLTNRTSIKNYIYYAILAQYIYQSENGDIEEPTSSDIQNYNLPQEANDENNNKNQTQASSPSKNLLTQFADAHNGFKQLNNSTRNVDIYSIKYKALNVPTLNFTPSDLDKILANFNKDEQSLIFGTALYMLRNGLH